MRGHDILPSRYRRSVSLVVNAIADALWRAYEVRHIDMQVTPERLWAAIAEGRRMHTL